MAYLTVKTISPPQKPSAATMPPDQVAPPSVERRKTPSWPRLVQAAPEVSWVAASTVTVDETLLMAKLTRMPKLLPPSNSTFVKLGVAASALVVRQMPPSPAALVPKTAQTMLLGLPGSNAMSVTVRSFEAVGTVSRAKAGVPASALVER